MPENLGRNPEDIDLNALRDKMRKGEKIESNEYKKPVDEDLTEEGAPGAPSVAEIRAAAEKLKKKGLENKE